MLLTAPNQGEVERLASLLQEYGAAVPAGVANAAAGVFDGVLGVELSGRAICGRR